MRLDESLLKMGTPLLGLLYPVILGDGAKALLEKDSEWLEFLVLTLLVALVTIPVLALEPYE